MPGGSRQPLTLLTLVCNEVILLNPVLSSKSDLVFVYPAEIDWPAGMVQLHELPLGAVTIQEQALVVMNAPSAEAVLGSNALMCRSHGALVVAVHVI
jgi:hypothetical protein